MKKYYILFLLLSTLASAQFNIVTSYPYLGKITKAIGGDKVKIKVLASAKFDPHFIVPKPSLVPAISRAKLLIANGAGLEIGWLPPLLRSAHNANVNIGASGFLDVSRAVRLIDKPKAVSRAYGDVHPEGNPHFDIDPHNIIPIAALISKKLSILDSANKAYYKHNLSQFVSRWKKFLKSFDITMKKCHGKNIVQYHELYNYLIKRYKMKKVGNIEPLPGIAPSSKHTIKLIQNMKQNHVKIILQDAYHEKRTAKFIASKTGAKVVVIPHDVGSVSGTDTLEKFYTSIAQRLCQ
jgi:zinc/manganese transport system substrate-binding protein